MDPRSSWRPTMSLCRSSGLATALHDYISMVSHKGVCSRGSYMSAQLRLSIFMRYIAGGHVKDIIHIMHGVHNSTFYQAIWQVVDFVNNTICEGCLVFDSAREASLLEVARALARACLFSYKLVLIACS